MIFRRARNENDRPREIDESIQGMSIFNWIYCSTGRETRGIRFSVGSKSINEYQKLAPQIKETKIFFPLPLLHSIFVSHLQKFGPQVMNDSIHRILESIEFYPTILLKYRGTHKYIWRINSI